MTRPLLSVLVLSATLCACGSATHPSPGPSSPRVPSPAGRAAAVRSTNQLALELLPRLGGSRNIVFSPYSIQTALAMIDQGAVGETRAQIDDVLGTPDPATLASADRSLRSGLARARAGHSDSPRLSIANDVSLQRGISLEPRFSRTLHDDFGAAPGTVDFQLNPASAARTINDWVSRRTQGLIKDLMPLQAVNDLTRLVLANAIYLKAGWQSPFDPSMTRARPFFSGGRRVSAKFMAQSPTVLPYGAGSGYQAEDLAYRESSLSMLLVMPTQGALGRFERSLAPSRVSAIERSLRSRPLDLAMPRFHLTTHTELNGALSAIGMPIAFTPEAQFSGVTGPSGPGLQIQAVEHGADLKVDEAGTMAAAATGISITPTVALGGHVTRLVLDHPFLALLRDDDTGAILFAAQVADPTS